jgi:hypothetical protein
MLAPSGTQSVDCMGWPALYHPAVRPADAGLDAAEAFRLGAWLTSDAASTLPPPVRGSLGQALERACLHARRLPHGTLVAFTRAGVHVRRALEIDRRGTPIAVLAWHDDGRLAEASVRHRPDAWVVIEPRATTGAPWGLADRLALGNGPELAGATPLTVFEAVDYAAVRTIPALAEPARLPPGIGTAVLNLIASLAADASVERLGYRGPYPTEALFLSLLESFRHETVDGAPLHAFMAGRLAWTPAPFERVFQPDGIVVQLRRRVEKVTWHGRTYYRPDWQSIERRAPRRVHDAAGQVACSLFALGMPVEEHLRLAADGAVLAVTAPSPSPRAPRAVPATVAAGVVEVVAATSAPALAPFVRAAGSPLAMAWAPVDRDLVRLDGDQVLVSPKILDAARACAANGQSRRAAVESAFAVLGEVAELIGDTIRARAQAALASCPPDRAAQAVGVAEDPGAAQAAAVIARAVDTLATELETAALSARGPDDEPDVEQDERRDGDG